MDLAVRSPGLCAGTTEPSGSQGRVEQDALAGCDRQAGDPCQPRAQQDGAGRIPRPGGEYRRANAAPAGRFCGWTAARLRGHLREVCVTRLEKHDITTSYHVWITMRTTLQDVQTR